MDRVFHYIQYCHDDARAAVVANLQATALPISDSEASLTPVTIHACYSLSITSRSALLPGPHAVHHVHHAPLCTLLSCRSASLSRMRSRARTIAQCSGTQVGQLAQADANGGCVDADDGDECCVRSCRSTGHVVDGSAQRETRSACSCFGRERGVVRWG